MGLYIAECVRKRKFGRTISTTDKSVVMEGARAGWSGTIASRALPESLRLLKTYARTKQAPRRIFHLRAATRQPTRMIWQSVQIGLLGFILRFVEESA